MKYLLKISMLLLVSLSACGGGDEGEVSRDRETFLRFINGVPDVRGLDFFVDSKVYFSSVGYLQSPGYFKIDTDSPDVRVTVSGSFATLYDSESSLDDNADQSLIVYGPADEPRSLLIDDDNEEPGNDVAKVRIINLSTSSRNVDVYLTQPRQSITNAVATADNLGFGAVSDYFVSDSGSYVLTITESDAKSPLGQRTNVTFEENSVYTIVVSDTAPGSRPLRTIVLKDR